MNLAPPSFLESLVTLDGITRTVAEWCEIKNINPRRVYIRRKAWMPWARAFSPEDLSVANKIKIRNATWKMRSA